MLGLAGRGAADRPRRVDLRHLRRLLLPRPGHRGRRRRRLGARGGHLPHQVRRHGHDHPPARRAAGLEDHAGAGVQERQDRVPLGHHGRRPPRRHQARGRRASATSRPARQPTSPSPALFVAIGHRPNTDLFKGQLEMEDNGYLITQDGSTCHQRRGRVRLRRRAGPHLPPGDHRRRVGLHGRHRRRALARRPAGTTIRNRDPDGSICGRRRVDHARLHRKRRHIMADGHHHPHRHHLRRGDRDGRRTGRRRLLGRVVRSVQDDRAHPRRDRRRAARASSGWPRSTSTTTPTSPAASTS